MFTEDESPEFINRVLQSLREKEDIYLPGDHVYDALGARSFTAIVGPIDVGKATISNEVIQLDPEIKLVNSTMTRERREGDPSGFRTATEGVTYGEFNNAVANANLVNFNVIGQHIYGTYHSGFPGQYNIGPIMSESIPQLDHSGFKRFNVAYMVVDGETYEQRLLNERTTFPDIPARFAEGQRSIDFARRNLTEGWLRFVENLPEPNGVTKAARKIIAMTRGNSSEILLDSKAEQYLDEMSEALHQAARNVH